MKTDAQIVEAVKSGRREGQDLMFGRYAQAVFAMIVRQVPNEQDAEELYKQFIALAYDYLNNHPEQPYRYKFTSNFSYINLEDVVEGINYNNDDDEYFLSFMRDEDGFHILSLRNKGSRWIPRDWEKIKSYVNGEKTYIKGMEPKKEKK